MLGVKIDESKQLETRARDVAQLAEVRSVAIVTGRYDLLVEVLVSSNQGLIDFLSESLAQVPGITSSETVPAAQDLRQVDLKAGAGLNERGLFDQRIAFRMRTALICRADLGDAVEHVLRYTRPTK